MKKITSILAATLLTITGAQASVINISNWEAVDLGPSGETSQFTVTVAIDGNDWLYSWTRTANFDGMGPANDTLSFDLRSAAFTGSSYDGTNVTLGTPFDYSEGGTVTTPTDQHFGPGYDLDNNQSFQLSIENISFTQGEGLGWVATFDGFSAINKFAAGNEDFYYGLNNAEVINVDTADQPFTGPLQVLTVTAPHNANRFRDLDFSFTTAPAIPEPGSLGLLGFGAAFIVLVRRSTRR